MLAASYATLRGLSLAALVPDFRRFPVDAVERRDAFLVGQEDAAVVMTHDAQHRCGTRLLIGAGRLP